MKAVVERGGRKLLSEIRGRVQMLGRWCLWVDMSTALTPFIVYCITLFDYNHRLNL